MGNNLVPKNEEQDDLETLEAIRSFFKVDQDTFKKGIECVKAYYADPNGSKNKAYGEVHGQTPAEAKKRSSRFFGRKWMQELLRHYQPDQETLYVGEVKRVIAVNMAIIQNPKSPNRDIIEATKALQPYIKAQAKLEMEVQHKVEASTGQNIVTDLNKKLALLDLNDKMVNENGEIIDVELIE